MKKIVSVWAIAALTLSAVFAADISIEYKTAGTVYKEEHTRQGTSSTTGEKSVFNQAGYDDGATGGEFVLSASSDIGGFVLDIDTYATELKNVVDQWYAWVNFGNLQTTVGLWKSRYVNRVNQDAGNWADEDFERYRPGVIGGMYAHDIDNLTYSTFEGAQKLATSVAYTIRPSDESYFMIKGLLVNAGGTGSVGDRWGGAFMSNGSYTNYFFSGFAGEFAFKLNGLFDINLALRSEKRDSIGAGLFFRPLLSNPENNLLVGFSFGTNFADYGDSIDSNYYEYAVDFRARFKLSDNLALTTMNNVSSFTDASYKGSKLDPNNAIKLWDMVSLAYDFSDQLKLQFTVESEAGIYARGTGADKNGKPKNISYYVGDLGGFDLSFIPGATWTFSENASLTAGLKFDFGGVGATKAYKDNNAVKSSFSIPVVIDIAL